MHAPTPRQAPRRHAPAAAALFAALGLLAAGCGGSDEPKRTSAESNDLYLQPVAAAGPDPFTGSSATQESAPLQAPVPNPTGEGIRTVGGGTPGLYGGTHRLGSCDIEQQLRNLTEDEDKARAFAQASGIEVAGVPEFLRGLTPVVLRADTRVTNHGFRDGTAHAYQAVLQAGTAVLVDGHGMPRVRCGCGNPLLSPRAAKGKPVHKGEQWPGYQPNQTIVIEPTIQAIANLTIVNVLNNTWLERTAGDDGAQDRLPQAAPPYDPAAGIPVTPETPANAQDPQDPPNPLTPQDPRNQSQDAPPDASRVPLPPRTRPTVPQTPDAPPSLPRNPSAEPGDPGMDFYLDPGPLDSEILPDPAGSADPAAPAEPVLPPEAAEPSDPMDPVDPVNPVDPFAVPDGAQSSGSHDLESA
ncbi:DUF6777 domain-containing protein [Streptomyces sp. NPDC090022]|uniref:DUF6777 domain-containing protein n=1 Tax=Streptomyces sp. NPDC090022 TaxID=3365920 RepID=UPI0038299763